MMAAARTPVAVALGSNLGDREAHLAWAVSRLHEQLTSLRVSAWRETAPVGMAPGAPSFLNGVAVGFAALDARACLDWLLALEQARGRSRPCPAASRTLDLDLILFGDTVLDEPGLVVPHPRFRERLFVLEPLAEVAGDWIDPVTGQTVDALCRAARPPSGDARV